MRQKWRREGERDRGALLARITADTDNSFNLISATYLLVIIISMTGSSRRSPILLLKLITMFDTIGPND